MPIPQSWEELADPIYKGKIAYCLPSKSGSAYTQLCTMLFAHGGTEDGWQFIEKLYENLDGKMVDSSGKCHKMVADGEFYIGLTLEKAAVQYAEDDSVGFVYPSDGTSAVPDGVLPMRRTPSCSSISSPARNARSLRPSVGAVVRSAAISRWGPAWPSSAILPWWITISTGPPITRNSLWRSSTTSWSAELSRQQRNPWRGGVQGGLPAILQIYERGIST